MTTTNLTKEEKRAWRKACHLNSERADYCGFTHETGHQYSITWFYGDEPIYTHHWSDRGENWEEWHI